MKMNDKLHKLRRGAVSVLALLVVLPAFLPRARAEDWQVVWKDSVATLRVDRDSVHADGPQVEYWYSDETDALVDWMEYRYHVVSDCENRRMRILEAYETTSGEYRRVGEQVGESGWREVPYDSGDPVAVMHDEVCSDYAGR